jgi:hypothetical protein
MHSHWVTASLQLLSFLAGCTCVALASMMHEDEELRLQTRVKKLQARVERWWITVDDSKILTLAWATSFVRGVARLTGTCFDRVFTTRLISLRIVGISFCLSIASLFFTLLVIMTFVHTFPTHLRE